MTKRSSPFIQSLWDLRPRLTATIERVKERGGKIDPRLLPQQGDYRQFQFEPSELSTVPLAPFEPKGLEDLEDLEGIESKDSSSPSIFSTIAIGVVVLGVLGGGFYVYRRAKRT